MNIPWYDIMFHGVAILGILASILSFQCKKHKPLVMLRSANELLFGIQYYMLGAYTGMTMNIIGVVRNTIFAKMVQKNKDTVKMRIFFSALFVIFACATWSGAKSILIGFAKVMSTFAYGSSRTSVVRALILVTSTAWLVYNLMVGSYEGCINEFLTLCSIVVGIIRLDILKLPQKTTA